MTFIARPSRLFRRYVRSTGSLDLGSYQIGRMAMALEIITQIKMLEEIKVMDDLSRAEAVSALHTLLQDCGLSDSAYEMYERLARWRVPKFEPIHPLLRHEPAPARIDVSDERGEQHLLPPPTPDEPSSQPVSPEVEPSPESKPQSSLQAHRDLGGRAWRIPWPEEGPSASGLKKPSE